MHTHSQSDTKFPSVLFSSVPWNVGVGQACNQLAVLFSRGCQLSCISLDSDWVYQCLANCPSPLLTTLLTTSNLITTLLLDIY